MKFQCIISVCKFKAHKRCAVKAQSNCKWTTLAAIGSEIIEDEDGVSLEPGCLFWANLIATLVHIPD